MKYPTQSPKSSETELDISANDKILKSPFYIAIKNLVIPTSPPLSSESHSPLRDLDPKSVCPTSNNRMQQVSLLRYFSAYPP